MPTKKLQDNHVYPPWLRVDGDERSLRDRVAHYRSLIEDGPVWIKKVAEQIDDHYLIAIGMFFHRRPFLYRNLDVARHYYELFSANSLYAHEALKLYSRQVSHGIQVALRLAENADENDFALKTPNDIARIERELHPEYQVRAEHVLQPFLRLALHVLSRNPQYCLPRITTGNKKRKPRRSRESLDYSSLPLGALAQPLRARQLDVLISGFDVEVRNAIAHGTIAFDESSVVYVKDDKAHLRLTGGELACLNDRLTDTTMGLLLGLILFCSFEISHGLEVDFPAGVKFIWAKEFSNSLGASIQNVIETQHHSSDKGRLIIHCSVETKVKNQYKFASLRLAYAANFFGFRTQEDYWMHVDVDEGVPAVYSISPFRMSASFDSPQSDLMQTPLLWHDGGKLERFSYVARHAIKWGVEEFERRMISEKLCGYGDGKMYEVRDIHNISVGDLRRLRAQVVVSRDVICSIDKWREVVQSVVAELSGTRMRSQLYKEKGLVRRRVVHMYIDFHLSDARARELKRRSSGGDGRLDYVMFVEWPAPNRIFPTFTQWSLGNSHAQINRKSQIYDRVFSHLENISTSV